MPSYPIAAPIIQRRSSYLEHQDELVGCSPQGLHDVPALLSRGFNDGSEYAEILGPFLGSETPRDLLSDFRHSQIPFRLVIRKRHSKVVKKE